MTFSFYLSSSLALAALLLGAERAQGQALTRNSPFMGPQSVMNAGPSGGSPQMYALVGVINADRNTRVGILDLSTRKSVWIGIGQNIGGIEALSYNPMTDEVVVRINGTLQTLSLRMPLSPGMFAGPVNSSPVAGPSSAVPGGYASAPFGLYPQGPGPFPPGTPGGAPMQPNSPPPPTLSASQAGPKSPATTATEERDARMMVSDLLDIGMQQRKAYQDAQRKAQQQKNAQPTPPPQQTTPPHTR